MRETQRGYRNSEGQASQQQEEAQGDGICEVEGAGIDAHVREALSVPGGKEYAYF